MNVVLSSHVLERSRQHLERGQPEVATLSTGVTQRQVQETREDMSWGDSGGGNLTLDSSQSLGPQGAGAAGGTSCHGEWQSAQQAWNGGVESHDRRDHGVRRGPW